MKAYFKRGKNLLLNVFYFIKCFSTFTLAHRSKEEKKESFCELFL